jgi:hypothetical protein
MRSLNYNPDISEFRGEKSFHINGMNTKTYYLHDYYPTNRYSDVDYSIKTVRRLIWDFKDGLNSEMVATKIVDAFRKKGLSPHNSCFAVIPASTANKTEQRFQQFAQFVADRLGILNSYSAIINRTDRDQMKGQSSGDKISTFDFNPNFYRYKLVYLFDDLFTSGTTFKQSADRLLSTGAETVVGIFLGNSMWETHEYNPDLFLDTEIKQKKIIPNSLPFGFNDLPF